MGQRLMPATRLTKCWSQPLAACIRELIVSRQLPLRSTAYPRGFAGHVAQPIRSIVISYRLIVQTCAPASQRLDVASGG